LESSFAEMDRKHMKRPIIHIATVLLAGTAGASQAQAQA
jgi:hypothetical protein